MMEVMNNLKKLDNRVEVVRTELQGSEKKGNFDDLMDAGTKEEARHITGICIRCGYIMDAIGIVVENGNKYLHGNAGGGSEEVISLEGDSLKTIRGDMGISFNGSAISNVTLEMKSGKKYGPFGSGRSGRTFELTVEENTEFVGFHGNASNSIVKSLGLICCKKDEEALKKMIGGSAGDVFKGFGM